MTGLLSLLLKLMNWLRLQDGFLAATKKNGMGGEKKKKEGKNKGSGSGYPGRCLMLCVKFRWTETSHVAATLALPSLAKFPKPVVF